MNYSTSDLSVDSNKRQSAINPYSNIPEGLSLDNFIRLGSALRQSKAGNQVKQNRQNQATFKDSKVGPYRKTRIVKSPNHKLFPKRFRRRLTYTDSESTPSHLRKHRKSTADLESSGMSLADRIKAKRQNIAHLDQSRNELQSLNQKQPDEALVSNKNDEYNNTTNLQMENHIPVRAEADAEKESSVKGSDQKQETQGDLVETEIDSIEKQDDRVISEANSKEKQDDRVISEANSKEKQDDRVISEADGKEKQDDLVISEEKGKEEQDDRVISEAFGKEKQNNREVTESDKKKKQDGQTVTGTKRKEKEYDKSTPILQRSLNEKDLNKKSKNIKSSVDGKVENLINNGKKESEYVSISEKKMKRPSSANQTDGKNVSDRESKQQLSKKTISKRNPENKFNREQREFYQSTPNTNEFDGNRSKNNDLKSKSDNNIRYSGKHSNQNSENKIKPLVLNDGIEYNKNKENKNTEKNQQKNLRLDTHNAAKTTNKSNSLGNQKETDYQLQRVNKHENMDIANNTNQHEYCTNEFDPSSNSGSRVENLPEIICDTSNGDKRHGEKEKINNHNEDVSETMIQLKKYEEKVTDSNTSDELKKGPAQSTETLPKMIVADTKEKVRSAEMKTEVRNIETNDNEQKLNNDKLAICGNDENLKRQIAEIANNEQHSGKITNQSKQGEVNTNTDNKQNDEEKIKNMNEKTERKTKENDSGREAIKNESCVSIDKSSTNTDSKSERTEDYGKPKKGINKDIKSLLDSLRSDIEEEKALSKTLIEEFQDFHDSPLVKFSKSVLKVRSVNALNEIPERRKSKSTFRSEGQLSDRKIKHSANSSSISNAGCTESASEVPSEHENLTIKTSKMEGNGNSKSNLEQRFTENADNPPETKGVINIDKENVTAESIAKTKQDMSKSMDCEINTTHANVEDINRTESKTVSDDIQKTKLPEVSAKTGSYVDENGFAEATSETGTSIVVYNSDQPTTTNKKSENTSNKDSEKDNMKQEQIDNDIDTTEMKHLNAEQNIQSVQNIKEEGITNDLRNETKNNKCTNLNTDHFDKEICQTNEQSNGSTNVSGKKLSNETSKQQTITEAEQNVSFPKNTLTEINEVPNKKLERDNNQTKDISSNNKQFELRKTKVKTKTSKNRRQKLRTQNSKTSVRFNDGNIQGKSEQEFTSQEKNDLDSEHQRDENFDAVNESKDEICEEVYCNTPRFNKNPEFSNGKLSSNESSSNFIYPPSIPKTPSFFNLREFKQTGIYERKRSDLCYAALPVTPSFQARRNSSLSDPIRTNHSGQNTSGILKNRRHSSALSNVTEKETTSPSFAQDKHLPRYPRIQKRKLRRRKGSSSISFQNLNEPDNYYMQFNLQEHYLEDMYEYMRIDRLNKEAFDISDDNMSSDGDKVSLKLPPLSGNTNTREDRTKHVDSDETKASSPNLHHVDRERSFFYITPLYRRGRSFTEINKTLSRVDEILMELSVYKIKNEKPTKTKHESLDCRSTLELTCNDENRVKLSIDHPRIIYDNTRDSFRTSKRFELTSTFSVKNEHMIDSRRSQKSKALNVLKRKLKMKNPIIG